MGCKKGDMVRVNRTQLTGVVLAVERHGDVIIKDASRVTHRIRLLDVKVVTARSKLLREARTTRNVKRHSGGGNDVSTAA
jgi:hypothetical protein